MWEQLFFILIQEQLLTFMLHQPLYRIFGTLTVRRVSVYVSPPMSEINSAQGTARAAPFRALPSRVYSGCVRE